MTWTTRLLPVLLAACATGSSPVPASEPPSGLPWYDAEDFTPRWDGPGLGRHRIGAFELVDQDGRAFTRDSLRGRVHVASFIYTSCAGICPLITRRLGDAYDALRERGALLVSYSVTPEMDTVEVLRKYAEGRGIDSTSWKLVTGPRTEIDDLARRSYFADEAPEIAETAEGFVHTERILLVDGELRIRGVYNGTLPVDMRHLVEDVETLTR